VPLLEWIFDPLPPSGAMQGGNASLHVFKPDLDTFVREVLQNSRDQRANGGTVRVEFTFEELDGKAKEQFLKAIGWNQLRPHVAGASQSRFAQISRNVEDGLRTIDEEPLMVLRIDDAGTRGLVGDEDDPNANYNALCRNTLVSRDSPQRGGSYGLGKAVLWRFSSILTVLFSSRVEGPPRTGFRLFGRSELPFHEAEGHKYAGAGWYGIPQQVDHGTRAISAWDGDAEGRARQGRLFRDTTLGTGTSILVVGFREPQQEEVRPVRHVAHDVANIAAKWFWPTIQRGELEVRVEARVNGQTVFEEEVEITSEVGAFAEAQEATELQAPSLSPGAVTEVTIPFRVPGRKPNGDAGSGPLDAQVRLRVRRTADGEGRTDLTNKVALTRGAGMVVHYKTVRMSTGERTYNAVLLAGLANGSTAADEAVEAFLRAAEPPAHDDWEVTPRVRSEYKTGFQVAIKDLWTSIDQNVARLFEEQAVDNTPGPARLAKMFHVSSPDGQPGGGGLKEKTPKFKPKNLNAYFDGETWQFDGQVMRMGRENRPWSIRLGLWLAGETGQGEALRIESLKADVGVKGRADGVEWILQVPADVAQVTFSGKSILVTDITDTGTAQRTRLDIDIRPALGENP